MKNCKRNATLLILIFLLVFTSCTSLKDLIQKPVIKVADVKTEHLDFHGLTLVMDVEISNPNPVGLELGGYHYDLTIEGASFISGTVEEKVSLEAGGKSVVSVPFTIVYTELKDALTAAAGQKELDYKITVGAGVPVPYLGDIDLETSHEGTLPVLTLPAVQVKQIRLDSLKLTGADLVLEVEIENPNLFDISLDSLRAGFSVSGQEWAALNTQGHSISSESSGLIPFPFHINFLSMGRSAYNILAGGKPLAYDLSGEIEWGTSLKFMQSSRIPLSLSGKTDIRK